jgi:cyanuric acid amidohydrolase
LTFVDLVKVATSAPDDVRALQALAAQGYSPNDVLAVIAKSEGNGCVNDFSRTLAARAWAEVVPADAVIVISGGTEGVLSPHVTMVVRAGGADGGDGGLRGAVAATADVAKPDLGRRAQMLAVEASVRDAMARADLTSEETHLVLVKCPLLTSEDLEACRSAGQSPVAFDTYGSMGRSRAASALGAALALGECSPADAEAALERPGWVWSSTASVSSGAELQNCKVVVLGSSAAQGRLRARHSVMRDAIDMPVIQALLRGVDEEGGQVVQVFAKAEADPAGTVRGRRHTMLTDSDVHSTRHARAAVGGLLAGMVGDPCIYVSGGAENQGPPGGGPVTVVYRVP